MNITRSSLFILKHGKTLGTKYNTVTRSYNATSARTLSPSTHNSEKNNIRFVSTYEVKDVEKESIVRRILYKIPFLNVKKNRIKASGYILYEDIVDTIDYFNFMDEFALPDTFFSWFAITELHIWMLSTRAMADGDNGRIFRNAVVEALWYDVDQRIKKLGVGTMKYQIMELSEQFQAALIAYDEGLQSDDTVLAGALWRRLYQMENVHVHKLEKLLKFVRKQVALLDNVSSDQLYKQKSIQWDYARNDQIS